jgi:hypothetical protein
MESTTNYSMFKEFSSNREIDEKHVRKLVREIQNRNLLAVNPILVDHNMHVVDGQHRLEAAKVLGVPIFYIVGDVRRDDISKINSNQKNWGLMDYLNYYTIEGKKAYLQISNLINHYPRITHSALVALSDPELTRSSDKIKNGLLDTGNIEFARQVCEVIMHLHELYGYEFVFDSKFPLALGSAMDNENFDLGTMYEKIAISPRSFVRCHSSKEYKKMIEEIYNYKVSKNKIEL